MTRKAASSIEHRKWDTARFYQRFPKLIYTSVCLSVIEIAVSLLLQEGEEVRLMKQEIFFTIAAVSCRWLSKRVGGAFLKLNGYRLGELRNVYYCCTILEVFYSTDGNVVYIYILSF